MNAIGGEAAVQGIAHEHALALQVTPPACRDSVL